MTAHGPSFHMPLDLTYEWLDPDDDGLPAVLHVEADYSWGPETNEVVEVVAAFDQLGVDRLPDLLPHQYEDARAQARALAHELLEELDRGSTRDEP